MATKQVFNTSAELDYPTVLPTLDLDFANSKTLDPRITFTRASGGTYVGADGLIKYAGVNEARFDHDPVTGESLGLLIEGARTNLSLNSQDFTDNESPQGWKISPTTSRAYLIANTGIDDPSGGTTASRWASGTTSVEELIYHILPSALTIGVTYTASVWIRRVSGTGAVGLVIGDNAGGFVTSQLDSVPYGTWVRCSFSRTITGATGAPIRAYISVYPSNFSSGTPTRIDIWGYQVEEGAFPTSYIPTQASTRTRALDNARIIGKNFSNWYNFNEGTFISNSSILKSGIQTQIVWRVVDGTNEISLRSPQNIQDRFRGNIGNVFTPFPGTGNTLDTTFKAAIAYNSALGRLQVGNSSDEVVPSQLPTLTSLNVFGIGNFGTGSSSLNGHISRLTYFPKRLPNSQLQALVS
jgi:hypothetical protein